MNRRTFLTSTGGASIAGAALEADLSAPLGTAAEPGTGFPPCALPSPHGVKLNLKPVMTNMIHTGVWEGPCRFNVVPVEEEAAGVTDYYDGWSKAVSSNRIGLDAQNVTMLQPALILFNETFTIGQGEFDKIGADGAKADAFLVSPDGSSVASYRIAEKYGKPVILSWGLGCRTVDIAAYARSHGREVHVPNGKDELNRLVSLLRARKVFTQTRILFPTDWRWPSVASVAGIDAPERLKERFGIELVTISYADLAREVERTLADGDQTKKAEGLAELLLQGADRSFIDKKHVVRSMEFYNAVVRLMAERSCNAFTIECFEFCSSRLPDKWKITPCVIHTLLKDQGIPSACEGDLGALLSMQLLMAVSRKSSHLGNMFFREGGRMEINHSAPAIRMNGHDKPGLPYQLGRFVKSGWGTKAVVDFMNNKEKRVTVARMNPAATGLLVLKGKLVGSEGWGEDRLGCSVAAFVVGEESGTAERFIRRQTDYGNHLVWVYGDYSDEMRDLGSLLGIDVEVIA